MLAIYSGRRNVTKNLLSICIRLGEREKKKTSAGEGIHEVILLTIRKETALLYAQACSSGHDNPQHVFHLSTNENWINFMATQVFSSHIS